jgi:hypothetical protein
MAAMPSVVRELPLDQPLYGKAVLIEHRRNIPRYARLISAGLQTKSSSAG